MQVESLLSNLLLSLILYEFLLLFLGVWGAGTGLVKKTPLTVFWYSGGSYLSSWLSFIPGRQMESIVWSILPLALLAARQSAWLLNVVTG